MENKLIHNIPASYAERDELRNRIQAFVDDLTSPHCPWTICRTSRIN